MTNPGTSAGRKRSPKTDDKLVLALLQQPTLDKAAAAAGISTATAWRRTQDPEFQDQLRKARREAFSQSVGRLQQAGPAAVNTLLRVMADPAAAAASKVRAASQVLEISVRAMELDDLEGRIARLEQDQENRSA
jgi:hypothetical protein